MKMSHDDGLEPMTSGRMRTILFVLAGVLLGFDVLGGALRYYFSMIHVELLLYFPKLMALLFAVFLPFRFGHPPGVRTDMSSVLWAYGIVLFSIWVAMFNRLSPASTGYMLLILAPFFFGMHVPRPGRSEMHSVFIAVAVMWLVTVFGVLLDCFIDYPWKDAELEIYGKVVEVSRSWVTKGVELDRLAGFTRLSVAAALYGGIFGVIIMRLSRYPVLRASVFVLTLLALMFTTTKSTVMAFLFVVVLQLLHPLPFLRLPVYVLMLLFGLALPLSSPPHGVALNDGNAVSEFLLASFHDRLMNTWPTFLDAMQHHFLGEGLGGIGSPNQMYGNTTSNPHLDVADNFALYLIGLFGVIPGITIFATLGYGAYRMAFDGSEWRQAVGLAGIFILVAGIAVDVVESVAGGILLGMIVRGLGEPAGDSPACFLIRGGGGVAANAFSPEAQCPRS